MEQDEKAEVRGEPRGLQSELGREVQREDNKAGSGGMTVSGSKSLLSS